MTGELQSFHSSCIICVRKYFLYEKVHIMYEYINNTFFFDFHMDGIRGLLMSHLNSQLLQYKFFRATIYLLFSKSPSIFELLTEKSKN